MNTTTRMILAWQAPMVAERIAALQARIDRNGLAGSITAEFGPVRVDRVHLPADVPGGYEIVNARVVDVTVTAETPVLPGGWKLAAVADWSGTDEALVFTVDPAAAGIDFDRARCDHCGTRRNRNRVIVVTNEAGELVHVGTSCARDFFGHDPYSVLGFAELTLEIDDDELWSGGRPDRLPLIEFVVAATAAYRAHGWRKAIETNSTRDTAMDLLTGSPRTLANLIEDDPAILDLAEAAIEWARTITPATDFDQNLLTVAESNEIGPKAFGIAAYLPVAYERHLTRLAEQEARTAAQGDAEPVPEGRHEIEGVILGWKTQYSDYGETVKMTVADDRGFRVFVTCPAALMDAERGDRVRLTCTMTRSTDDPTFGFGKRPAKASLAAAV